MSRCTNVLSIYYAPLADGIAILPDQNIKPKKIASISTVMVQCRAAFTNVIRSLLSSAQTCKEGYIVCFANVRVIYINDKMISSSFLAAYSRMIQRRYDGVVKMMVKRYFVPSFFLYSAKNASAMSSMSNTHHDERSLFIPYEKEIFFMMTVADLFDPMYSLVNAFYRQTVVPLDEPQVRPLDLVEEQFRRSRCSLKLRFSKRS